MYLTPILQLMLVWYLGNKDSVSPIIIHLLLSSIHTVPPLWNLYPLFQLLQTWTTIDAIDPGRKAAPTPEKRAGIGTHVPSPPATLSSRQCGAAQVACRRRAQCMPTAAAAAATSVPCLCHLASSCMYKYTTPTHACSLVRLFVPSIDCSMQILNEKKICVQCSNHSGQLCMNVGWEGGWEERPEGGRESTISPSMCCSSSACAGSVKLTWTRGFPVTSPAAWHETRNRSGQNLI